MQCAPRTNGNAILARASTANCDAMAKWTAQPTSRTRPTAVSQTRFNHPSLRESRVQR